MNRAIVVFVSLLGLVSLGFGQAGKPSGSLIVVPKEGHGAGLRYIDLKGARVLTTIAGGRILLVKPPNNVHWSDHRRSLLASGQFASVEADTWTAPCATPNDPEFGLQWHLGQISAPRAWDFAPSVSSVVAVVDGGVDLSHPDLAPNLVPGYNTLTELAQTAGGVVSDVRTNGHGTRIAGIIAAKGNNGIGVAGVGWNLKVMPIRVTDDAVQGFALRSELLQGAQWALDHGAKVVSISYTGVENGDVQTMGEYAGSLGAHLVWAAGNTNTDWSGFDHSAVTVVGGTGNDDSRWVSGTTVGSGYGRGVDIYAPCIQIRTTNKGGGYGYAPAGTSFAVPQVAAALAIVAAYNPTWSPWKVERRVLMSSRDLGLPGADLVSGWGRLNLGKAIDYPNVRYQVSFLETSPGTVQSAASAINDNDIIFGWSDSNGGQMLWWQVSTLKPVVPAAWLGVSGTPVPTEANNANFVVGSSNGNPWKGFAYLVGAGPFAPPPATAYTNSKYLGLSEAGHIAGSDFNDQTVNSGWVRLDGGNLLLEPPGAGVRAYDVNDLGHHLGNISWTSLQPNIYVGGQSPIYYASDTYSRNDPLRLTNRGDIVGNEFDFELQYQSRPYFMVPPYASYSRIMLAPPWQSEVLDINEQGFAVGRNHGQSQAIICEPGFGEMSFLRDKLVSPLPSNILALVSALSVNNRGVIVGEARTFGFQSVPFKAVPVTSANMLVNLGQLGESPTYIGSIPPSLSVTYLNDLGQPYTGGTVLQTYNVSVGRLELVPPPSVTGPYRMYLRCSGALIPGYPGPRYLNKLYPPMNEPAAGPDTVFLPYSGPSPTGADPALLMFAGDVDSSGEVDAADIDVIISKFGTVDGGPGWQGDVDVDGTGEIDAADIDLVISNFGLVDDPLP
ncbi:MAG: S8 family serine peptidase [Chthonomonas sp.]|nr:S8 family serine peptidase [Chthonomonas sp.]